MREIFKCPTKNCAYAIDAAGLNRVQLQVLRRWAKICPKCGNRAHFIEQTTLLDTETTKANGGQYANTNPTVPKSAHQKRKEARHDGQH